MLDCVILEPKRPARFSIVWLHGLGADGHDFEPIAAQLRLEKLRVRFVFPHAPIRPVTVNRGAKMRAWFDAYGPDHPKQVDHESIAQSRDQVTCLLKREIEQLPSSRVVLAGFSQGGLIALEAGLALPEKLAGLMVLSGTLPSPEEMIRKLTGPNKDIPIFASHGSKEVFIPAEVRVAVLSQLRAQGCCIDWRVYDRGHSVCTKEITHIRSWLFRIWA